MIVYQTKIVVEFIGIWYIEQYQIANML